MFFKEYSDEYVKHYKTYKPIVKERDSLMKSVITVHADKLLLLLPNNPMAKKLVAEMNKDYLEKYNLGRSKLKAYTKRKKQLSQNHSFRGRSSKHFWISIFGLITALFYFIIKSLRHNISTNKTFKFSILEDVSGLIIVFFWGSHYLFLTQKDFSQNKYIGILLVCSLLITTVTYYLVKYFSYKDIIILKLLAFIERVKHKHYKEIAVKAIYFEDTDSLLKTDKSIDESMDDFDNDLMNSIKGI